MPNKSARRPDPTPLYSRFSCLPMRLKDWRAQHEVKVSTAAAELGVAASTWNHWESGRRFPSGLLLIQLIDYTGISLKQLVCENAHICPFCTREPKGPRRPSGGHADSGYSR